MKIRALGVAVSLVLCTSPLMAGTVNFSAVGYGQYGDAQSYPLPIANYRFGYDINDGPFVPALSPVKESLLSAAVGSGMEGPGKRIGFSHTLDKLYPPLPAKVAGQLSRNTAGRQSADMQPGSLFLAKGDSLLPLGSFSAAKDGAPAVGADYPSVTPSIAAWSKEWITDTSESIEADFEPPEIFLNVSSLEGVNGVVENAQLVDFQNGVPSPVSRAGRSQTRPGNIIAAAQSSSGKAGPQGPSGLGPAPGPGSDPAPKGGQPPKDNPSPGKPEPKPEKTKCDPADAKCDPASPDNGPKKPDGGKEQDTYVDPENDPKDDDGESGGGPLLPDGEGDPVSPEQPGGPGFGPTGGSSETPEPGTLLLLGGSLLGLSILRRRNGKA